MTRSIFIKLNVLINAGDSIDVIQKFLRTYATKTSHLEMLSNTLHTVCFMHGLSIYEIKIICHRAQFFIIIYGNFQHLTIIIYGNFQQLTNFQNK